MLKFKWECSVKRGMLCNTVYIHVILDIDTSSFSDSVKSDSLAYPKTMSDATLTDASMSDVPILTQAKAVQISGTLSSSWKQENILGDFTV